MSNKLTAKQVKFIEGIKQNKTPTEAYTYAGYTAKNEQVARVSSGKLLRLPRISKEVSKFRTRELAKKAKIAEDVEVSQQWLIQQYVVTIEDAREARQYSAVRNCLRDIGSLCGLFIDKKELAVSGEVNHLKEIDTDSLMDALQNAQKPQPIEAEFRTVKEDSEDHQF